MKCKDGLFFSIVGNIRIDIHMHDGYHRKMVRFEKMKNLERTSIVIGNDLVDEEDFIICHFVCVLYFWANFLWSEECELQSFNIISATI